MTDTDHEAEGSMEEAYASDMAVDQNIWKIVFFADKVWQGPSRPPIYTGEDELDEYDDFDMSFVYELNANTLPQKGSSDDAPEVHVPLDVYKEALVPWKRALFLKLMGKSISMKVLKSRVESLWNLCGVVN